MVKLKDIGEFVDKNFWCTDVNTDYEAKNTVVDYTTGDVKLDVDELVFDADDIKYIVENYKEMVMDALLDNLSKKEREELAKRFANEK